MNLQDKKEILQHLKKTVLEKINLLKTQISNLTTDAQNDAKGSAGDKHETSLAMMHLEQEKLSTKLEQTIIQYQTLQKINIDFEHQFIALGSLVNTQNAVFFVSEALPQFVYKEIIIFPLSINAPIFSELKGKKQGETLFFNSKKINIDFII